MHYSTQFPAHHSASTTLLSFHHPTQLLLPHSDSTTPLSFYYPTQLLLPDSFSTTPLSFQRRLLLLHSLLYSFLTSFLVDAIAAQSKNMADHEEPNTASKTVDLVAETVAADRKSNRQKYVVETQQMLDNQRRDSMHEISGCITKKAASTRSTVRDAQANIIDDITSTHASTKQDILGEITAEAVSSQVATKTCVDECKAKLLADNNVKAINTRYVVQKGVAEMRADVAKEARSTQDTIIERLSCLEDRIDMLFRKMTEMHEHLRKIAADKCVSEDTMRKEISDEARGEAAETRGVQDTSVGTWKQKDNLGSCAIAQPKGSNPRLADNNQFLAHSNNVVSGSALQAQQLNFVKDGNIATQNRSSDILHDKRTLQLDFNAAAEEITRSRRQRVDQPVDQLASIRIWTGSEERSFNDLHRDVQEAIRSWLVGHPLGASWFETAQRRITSCIRNARTEGCYVRNDDERVACSLCVGGRTPCIRRRARNDPTLCLFPVHHVDRRREVTINDVAFWICKGRRGNRDDYNKKLFS